jgi:hypothetical protein
LSRVRDVVPVDKLTAQVIESHAMRGRLAQLAIDELLEECRCGHVRAAHMKPGQCCELACDCRVFRRAVR